MNKINVTIKRFLLLAIIISVIIPPAIVCIVFGAVKWNVPLLTVGICFFVLSFYSVPFCWIKVSRLYKDKKLIGLIETDKHTLKQIAEIMDVKYSKLLRKVQILQVKNYLPDYKFSGNDTLVRKESVTCFNCGAKINTQNLVCPFCGTENKQNTK